MHRSFVRDWLIGGWAVGAAFLAMAACTNDRTRCDDGSLRDALARAGPGDVVRLEPGCVLTASDDLLVFGGVTLESDGVGDDRAKIVLQRDARIEMGTWGSGTAALRRIVVVSDGKYAVAALGADRVLVEDVVVESSAGSGIGVESSVSAEIRRTVLQGAVTELNAESQPLDPSSDDAVRCGLVAAGVDSVLLDSVEASGWGKVAVYLDADRVEWEHGYVGPTLGVGICVTGAEAQLTDVELSTTLQGTRLWPAVSLWTSETNLDTTGLFVHDSEGYGVVSDEGVVHHRDPIAEDNANAAFWLCDVDATIEGATISGNGFAGIKSVAAQRLVVENTRISTTRAMTHIIGTMPVQIGDGLIIGEPHDGPLILRSVDLEGPERAGATIELAEPFQHPFVVADVSVSPAERGFVVTGGPPPDGWRDGVSPSWAARTELYPTGTGGGTPDPPDMEPLLP